MRGERNCELFELGIEDGNFTLTVWNNAGMGHECPDEWLAQIDRNAYYVDGPRWRSLDAMLSVDADGNVLMPESPLDVNPDAEVREVPAGLGLDMLLAAKVTIAPVSRVETNLDIAINSLDDLPDDVRLRLMSGRAAEDAEGYRVMQADRQQNTLWVYKAGNPVYTLSDGECTYAMKYYTSAINPDIVNETIIADLGNRFTKLPDGFTFEIQTFDEDMYIAALNFKQNVVADEFGNSYDLLSCEG